MRTWFAPSFMQDIKKTHIWHCGFAINLVCVHWGETEPLGASLIPDPQRETETAYPVSDFPCRTYIHSDKHTQTFPPARSAG